MQSSKRVCCSFLSADVCACLCVCVCLCVYDVRQGGSAGGAAGLMGELVQLMCVGESDHASTITSDIAVDSSGSKVGCLVGGLVAWSL